MDFYLIAIHLALVLLLIPDGLGIVEDGDPLPPELLWKNDRFKYDPINITSVEDSENLSMKHKNKISKEEARFYKIESLHFTQPPPPSTPKRRSGRRKKQYYTLDNTYDKNMRDIFTDTTLPPPPTTRREATPFTLKLPGNMFEKEDEMENFALYRQMLKRRGYKRRKNHPRKHTTTTTPMPQERELLLSEEQQWIRRATTKAPSQALRHRQIWRTAFAGDWM